MSTSRRDNKPRLNPRGFISGLVLSACSSSRKANDAAPAACAFALVKGPPHCVCVCVRYASALPQETVAANLPEEREDGVTVKFYDQLW